MSRPNATGKAPDRSAATPEQDAVSLTDTATNLQRIEAKLAAQPDVDAERVEAVRASIEAGSYEPDANAIAAKLLRMDRQLG